MTLTAYCPVARGSLDDPVVGEIAKARRRTHAQICLRWLVQQPIVAAVPRASSNSTSSKTSMYSTSLSDKEMRRFRAAKKEHPHCRPA